MSISLASPQQSASNINYNYDGIGNNTPVPPSLPISQPLSLSRPTGGQQQSSYTALPPPPPPPFLIGRVPSSGPLSSGPLSSGSLSSGPLSSGPMPPFEQSMPLQSSPMQEQTQPQSTGPPGFFTRHKTLIITTCVIVGAVVLCQLIGKKCKENNSNSSVCKVANAINSFVDAIAAPFVWVFNHFLLLMCLGLLAIGLRSFAGFLSRASDAVRDYVQASEVENEGDAEVWVKDGEPYLVDKDGKLILNRDGKPLRPTEEFAQQAQMVVDANRQSELLKDVNINMDSTLNGDRVPAEEDDDVSGDGVAVNPLDDSFHGLDVG